MLLRFVKGEGFCYVLKICKQKEVQSAIHELRIYKHEDLIYFMARVYYRWPNFEINCRKIVGLIARLQHIDKAI